MKVGDKKLVRELHLPMHRVVSVFVLCGFSVIENVSLSPYLRGAEVPI